MASTQGNPADFFQHPAALGSNLYNRDRVKAIPPEGRRSGLGSQLNATPSISAPAEPESPPKVGYTLVSMHEHAQILSHSCGQLSSALQQAPPLHPPPLLPLPEHCCKLSHSNSPVMLHAIDSRSHENVMLYADPASFGGKVIAVLMSHCVPYTVWHCCYISTLTSLRMSS